jgi:hypothetical protein
MCIVLLLCNVYLRNTFFVDTNYTILGNFVNKEVSGAHRLKWKLNIHFPDYRSDQFTKPLNRI